MNSNVCSFANVDDLLRHISHRLCTLNGQLDFRIELSNRFRFNFQIYFSARTLRLWHWNSLDPFKFHRMRSQVLIHNPPQDLLIKHTSSSNKWTACVDSDEWAFDGQRNQTIWLTKSWSPMIRIPYRLTKSDKKVNHLSKWVNPESKFQTDHKTDK